MLIKKLLKYLLIVISAVTMIYVFTFSAEASNELSDTFDGTTLDTTKWQVNNSGGGQIQQDGEIIATTDSSNLYSRAQLNTNYKFCGNFDVQVDFTIDGGWSRPEEVTSNSHLDGAVLGVIVEGNNYTDWVHIARIAEYFNDKIGIYWNGEELLRIDLASNSEATNGQYRIIRAGTNFDFYYNGYIMYSFPSEVTSWKIYFGSGSVEAYQKFTTYFDNFIVNIGTACSPPACSTWDDVMAKFQEYVNGQATWDDVITCFSQYVSQ